MRQAWSSLEVGLPSVLLNMLMSAHIKDIGRSFSFLCHSFWIAQGQEPVSGTGDSDESLKRKKDVIFWLLTIIQAQIMLFFLLSPPLLPLHLGSCLPTF